MKSLIFDTDVLSTFGKIRKIDLLRKLLPDATFLIPPSVYGELFKARDHGYEFVDPILWGGILGVTPLTKEELEFLSKLREERRSLGSGELEGYLSVNTGVTFLLRMIRQLKRFVTGIGLNLSI